MCRWHVGCDDPVFECKAIKITDHHTKHLRKVGIPWCTRCDKSPPLERLIPELAKDWQPNPMPEDENSDELDLRWPVSVFGEPDKPERARRLIDSAQDFFLEVEVSGSALTLEMVDVDPIDGSQLRLMRLSPQEGNEPVCTELLTFEDDNMPVFEAVSYNLGGESRNITPFSQRQTAVFENQRPSKDITRPSTVMLCISSLSSEGICRRF